MTLEEMKAVDIRTVRREDLVDIRDVHIDRTLPKEERIKDFIKQSSKIIVSSQMRDREEYFHIDIINLSNQDLNKIGEQV